MPDRHPDKVKVPDKVLVKVLDKVAAKVLAKVLDRGARRANGLASKAGNRVAPVQAAKPVARQEGRQARVRVDQTQAADRVPIRA